MFLPNLETILNHIFGALINGGKFAAAVWSIPSKVPFIGFPMSIVMRQLQIPQPTSRVPGPFSLADDGVLESWGVQRNKYSNISLAMTIKV